MTNGGGLQTVPDQSIAAAPNAVESVRVGGYPASSLLRVTTNGLSSGASAAAPILNPAGAAELLNLVNGSSAQYLKEGANGAGVAPASGHYWYDTSAHALKFYDGTTVQTVSAGGAVNGSSITSGTIGGTTSMITSGSVSAGTVTGALVSGTSVSAQTISIFNASNAFAETISVPASLGTNFALTLPPTAGANGSVLTTDGAGTLSWSPPGASSQWANGLSGAIGYVGGNVGIGTTAPDSGVNGLDIEKNYAVAGGDPGMLLIRNANASSFTQFAFRNDSNAYYSGFYLNGTARAADGGANMFNYFNDLGGTTLRQNGDLIFMTGAYPGVEKMRMTAAGNVGIGTTTPGSPLDVKGAIRMSGSASGYAGFQPAAAAGSTVWTLPTSDGTLNQVLTTNGAGLLSWSTPIAGGGSGTVTNVSAGTGLLGGAIATSGTLSVDVGTTANKIVQLDGSAQIPAVSGALLTSLNANNVAAGTLAIARGGTGLSASPSAGQIMLANGTGAWTLFGCSTTGQTLSWTVGVGFGCATPASGTVTSVVAGTGLSGGTIVADGTIALANTSVAAGSYGDASDVPQLTIDAQGRVTSAAPIAIGGLDASAIATGTIAAARLPANSGLWTLTGSDAYYSAGKVGVGAAPTYNFDVNLTATTSSAATRGINSNIVANPGANSTFGITALRGSITSSGTNAIGGMYVAYSYLAHNGGNAVGSAYASNNALVVQGSGSLSDAKGVLSQVVQTAASTGTVSYVNNAHFVTENDSPQAIALVNGVESNTVNNSPAMMTTVNGLQSEIKNVSSGSIDQGTGLNLTLTVSAGAVNKYRGINFQSIPNANPNYYAIYSDGLAQSYFAGNVGVGSAVPASKLEVQSTLTDPTVVAPHGEYVALVVNPTASSAQTADSINANTTSIGANSLNQVRGATIGATHSGTGNVNGLTGGWGFAANASSGSVATVVGQYGAAMNYSGSGPVSEEYGGMFYTANYSNSNPVNYMTAVRAWTGHSASNTVSVSKAVDASIQNTGPGTVADAYGIYASYGNSGGGAITNYKGVYVAPVDANPNYWGIYVDGPNTQSYFGGNVGIGTASAVAPLTVQGQAFFSYGGVKIAASGPSSGNFGLLGFDDGKGTLNYSTSGGSKQDFIFSNAGNVGVGTTSPAQKLSVAGTIESTSGGIKFPDGTVQTTASSSGAAAVGFKAYGSAQALANGAQVTVINPTVAYDKSSNYDSATGVFTAPVAGVYECVCRTDIETGVNNASFNTTYSGFVVTGGDSGANAIAARSFCQYAPCTLVATDQINLSANGTVACATYQSAGGSVNLSGDSRTAFSCYKLGP